MCRLLHLKIISLKNPLQIGLCNKAFPIQELIPIPVMTTRSILISIKTTKIDLNNQVPFWNWQNISIFIIFSHQI
ncbi:hypothetical protein CAS75_13020 [Acinetobacter baumannii]|nr:hypothetical protein BTH09_14920 [Acinetobacter baumannii]OTT46056.1 hypothetical protein CAS75_13020 [Acinetobacter baumannii]